MIIETKILPMTIDDSLLTYLNLSKENTLIIDIETTGFSRERNHIYLIGCLYYTQGHWHLKQWLCEHLNEEAHLLESFLLFIKDGYTNWLYFNGDSFDYPFIKERCQLLHLDFPWDTIKTRDLYKLIKPYKAIFSLESLKQKTLEEYLGLYRKDPFTGGELIGYYYHYLRNHSQVYKSYLLLHNQEDLTGFIQLLPFLYYPKAIQTMKESTDSHWEYFENQESLSFTYGFSTPFPKNICYTHHLYQLELKGNQCQLTFPYYKGCLKYFFKPYHDYYYLPDEDQAVHKSVAHFVSPKRRQKAKASNCYIKKRGSYLPLFDNKTFSTFKEDYHMSMYYVPKEEVLKDTSSVFTYLKEFLRSF